LFSKSNKIFELQKSDKHFLQLQDLKHTKHLLFFFFLFL
jgi:hypothetical protein